MYDNISIHYFRTRILSITIQVLRATAFVHLREKRKRKNPQEPQQRAFFSQCPGTKWMTSCFHFASFLRERKLFFVLPQNIFQPWEELFGCVCVRVCVGTSHWHTVKRLKSCSSSKVNEVFRENMPWKTRDSRASFWYCLEVFCFLSFKPLNTSLPWLLAIIWLNWQLLNNKDKCTLENGLSHSPSKVAHKIYKRLY